MPTDTQSYTDTQSSAVAPGTASDPDIVYHEPAFVFAHWYNKYRGQFPSQRPPLKWLSANSRLPFTTCQYYRSRMEQAFPDAYAVASAGRNLRLAKRRHKRPGKRPDTPAIR